MRDLVLTRSDVAAYAWASYHLDVLDFRRVAPLAMARDLELSVPVARLSLRRLADRGYLETGMVHLGLPSYRLIYNPPPVLARAPGVFPPVPARTVEAR